MSNPDRRRLAFQVLWNLRGLGLFLIGPALGVWAGAAIFGMPRGLVIVSCAMFLVSLGMYSVLLRGEWRRLAAGRRPWTP